MLTQSSVLKTLLNINNLVRPTLGMLILCLMLSQFLSFKQCL